MRNVMLALFAPIFALLAFALAACSPEKQVAAPSAAATVTPSADPFAGARLMADVESYVGFGTHRTGSAGDVATSDWFAKRWRELGYEIEQTEFAVPNADTKVAKLRIGSEAFDGFAQPPLSFSPEGGINAPLASGAPGAAASDPACAPAPPACAPLLFNFSFFYIIIVRCEIN